MYYSQEVLDNFGEDKIEKLLLNGTNINIFSSNYQDRVTFNALENYIIKYYRNAKNEQLRKCIEDRLNYLFELLEIKPYVLVYSRILSNKDITKIFIQGNRYRFLKYGRAINDLERNFIDNHEKGTLGVNKLNLYAYLLLHTKFDEILGIISSISSKKASKILLDDKIPEDDISKIFILEYVVKYIMYKYSKDDIVKVQLANLVTKTDGVFRASIIKDDSIYINPDDNQKKYKKLEEMLQVVSKSSIRFINKKYESNIDEEDESFNCMQELYNIASKELDIKTYEESN